MLPPLAFVWGVTVDRYFWYFASSLLCSHGNGCYIECQEAQNHLRMKKTPTLSADSPSALEQHSYTHSHTCSDDDVKLNSPTVSSHSHSGTIFNHPNNERKTQMMSFYVTRITKHSYHNGEHPPDVLFVVVLRSVTCSQSVNKRGTRDPPNMRHWHFSAASFN